MFMAAGSETLGAAAARGEISMEDFIRKGGGACVLFYVFSVK
jgi:hypothetical protein